MAKLEGTKTHENLKEAFAGELAFRNGAELCLGVEHSAYRAELVLGRETLSSPRDDFA